MGRHVGRLVHPLVGGGRDWSRVGGSFWRAGLMAGGWVIAEKRPQRGWACFWGRLGCALVAPASAGLGLAEEGVG